MRKLALIGTTVITAAVLSTSPISVKWSAGKNMLASQDNAYAVVSNTRTDSTSQGTSVYVAGNAKYCKETAVSGYLDCFYSSPDACEKHNKSANLRCVANPNSGT
jgi:hypothetical protein